jgi:hypothetical protein
VQEIKDWVESTRLAQEAKEQHVIFYYHVSFPRPLLFLLGRQQEATGVGVGVGVGV